LYKHESENIFFHFLHRWKKKAPPLASLSLSPNLLAAEAKRGRLSGGEMDGAGEDGKQQPHLVLAHKLFLLSHPDVDDLAKVDLRADVLAAVKSDGSTSAAPPPFLEYGFQLPAGFGV